MNQKTATLQRVRLRAYGIRGQTGAHALHFVARDTRLGGVVSSLNAKPEGYPALDLPWRRKIARQRHAQKIVKCQIGLSGPTVQ